MKHFNSLKSSKLQGFVAEAKEEACMIPIKYYKALRKNSKSSRTEPTISWYDTENFKKFASLIIEKYISVVFCIKRTKEMKLMPAHCGCITEFGAYYLYFRRAIT